MVAKNDLPDTEVPPAVQHTGPTQKLTRKRVKDTLNFMRSKSLNLDDFLYAVFYGDSELRSDIDAKKARNELSQSPHFAKFLRNFYRPPRTKSKGSKAKESAKVYLGVAKGVLERQLTAELDDCGSILWMHPAESHDLCAEGATETLFEDIRKQAPTRAPTLTSLL